VHRKTDDVPESIRSDEDAIAFFGLLIDLCINNAIIGVQEPNTYAQTEGKRRPARRSTQASLGIAGFWLLSQRSGTAYRLQCKFCDALA
jgi:hypothetical protein